ncbi:MAG: translation initiation factor IF-1 [Acidobacteria bacterium]|nr:translation initiation factor IF-1 [Acidobacteriota bacterium]
MEIPTAGRSSTYHGVVEKRLPDALFSVRLTEASRRIVAHVDATPRRNFIRLLPGDRVTVELAVRNRARGRITRRGGTE